MRREQAKSKIIATAILIAALAPTFTPAFAYIDPGTGSLIIQSVIGAIAAIGVTIKLYWHKLKIFFSGRSAPTEPALTETIHSESKDPQTNKQSD